jgi:hypothetical protein
MCEVLDAVRRIDLRSDLIDEILKEPQVPIVDACIVRGVDELFLRVLSNGLE